MLTNRFSARLHVNHFTSTKPELLSQTRPRRPAEAGIGEETETFTQDKTRTAKANETVSYIRKETSAREEADKNFTESRNLAEDAQILALSELMKLK